MQRRFLAAGALVTICMVAIGAVQRERLPGSAVIFRVPVAFPELTRMRHLAFGGEASSSSESVTTLALADVLSSEKESLIACRVAREIVREMAEDEDRILPKHSVNFAARDAFVEARNDLLAKYCAPAPATSTGSTATDTSGCDKYVRFSSRYIQCVLDERGTLY